MTSSWPMGLVTYLAWRPEEGQVAAVEERRMTST
jgi:hypothetical protein